MSGSGSDRRAWALAAFLAAACAGVPPLPTGLDELVDLPRPLPRGPAAARALLEEGDRAWERRDEDGMPEAARLSYWKAAGADPDLADGYWKAARASSLVGRRARGKEARSDAFERGARTAQLLLERAPDLPEAHYYYATNLGLLARERPTTGKASVKTMIPHLELAAEHRPELEDGGPIRTLALVYLRAPGWPASVGDEELGLDYARRAVEHAPHHPGNHLALAEALEAVGERSSAREALARARELAAADSWTTGERREFLEEADRLENKLD